MTRSKVLLADDHAILRDGLRLILEQAPDIEIVGEASDGRAVLEMVAKRPLDIVVMDITMPNLNGIEATRQITAKHPAVKVIALSAYWDRRYVEAMLEAGARGYVVKEAAAEEVLLAIRAAVRNEVFLSPKVAASVVDGYSRWRSSSEFSSTSLLGAREREVLQLIAEGQTSKEVASTLHISTSTVEAHRRNIMRKLDLHSVAELTKYAIREGLTTPDS